MPSSDLLFRQLFEPESSTYTYILADSKTKEAVIIDPVVETSERDIQLLRELDLNLKYILETHVHADHITGADRLQKAFPNSKTVLTKAANVDCADMQIDDGDLIQFGSQFLKCITTPGHTDSCCSYYTPGMVFTGDTLLIRGCGRTDFQQGSSEKLFNSVREKLFSLPDETLVYPAHDYKGRMNSSILEEKRHNPRLGLDKSLDEFKSIMSELKLAKPKKIDQAVPANLKCGRSL